MAKYLSIISGAWREVVGLVTSTGAADAGKLVQTASNGYLDPSVMPPGIGASQKIADANGAITVRDFVYIETAGTIARASAAAGGSPAQGFATGTVSDGQPATMQTEGVVTGFSGLTPGARYYLSDTTPGGYTEDPVSGTNKIHQVLGTALSATELLVELGEPVYLA